jgi:hypothetical protein
MGRCTPVNSQKTLLACTIGISGSLGSALYEPESPQAYCLISLPKCEKIDTYHIKEQFDEM